MPYTETEKKTALDWYEKAGAKEAMRQTGVNSRTVLRWANAAGMVSVDDQEKTQTARAAAAERVQRTWADFRENEALAAGAAANKMRNRLTLLADSGAPGRELKDVAVTYAILIDKAELLSGQATQRIEHWATSELDRELRTLAEDMEQSIRERRTGS